MEKQHDSSMISREQIEEIRNVAQFKESVYRNLDIEKTIVYYKRKYVDVLTHHYADIAPQTVVLDVGCGYGWLTHALVMTTGCQVIAVDANAKRLEAARTIGEILNVSDRVTWLPERLGDLSLPDRSVDVIFAIEILEHVNRNKAVFEDLSRLAKCMLVLTTPNLLFPVIAHDTRLPFCHWLPLRARKYYAKLAGRANCENSNRFWSAFDLDRNLAGFKRVSKILHYPGWAAMMDLFPLYAPYRGDGYLDYGPRGVKWLCYKLASLLGTRSHYVMPNLASVYKR